MNVSTRRRIWWATTPFILVISLVLSIIRTITAVFNGMFAVVENLSFRFEMWSVKTPRGYFMNCPYKQTLKEVFMEGAGF